MPDPVRDKLLWFDIETTGLEPTEPTLEIGMRVTTTKLETIHDFSVVIHRTDGELSRMSEFVRAMHEKTGLLDEVRNSLVGEREAFLLASDFVHGHFPEGRALLCGSSIHFDRGFIKVQMPHLEAQLHYRMIDATALSEARRVCLGESWPKENSRHRAIPDIEASIRSLKCSLGLA